MAPASRLSLLLRGVPLTAEDSSRMISFLPKAEVLFRL